MCYEIEYWYELLNEINEECFLEKVNNEFDLANEVDKGGVECLILE